MSKKLYFVKREVIAENIKQAMVNKGVIYSIELAEEKLWPENKKTKPNTGFNHKQKHETSANK